MAPRLVSAVGRTTPAPPETARWPLADRAAARRDGRIPAALDRITTGSGNVPAVAAFGSAL